MKRIITFLLILLNVIILEAKHVDELTALNLAQKFFQGKNSTLSTKQAKVNLVYKCVRGKTSITQQIQKTDTYYYVFNYGDGGFIFLSADDNVIPVLGYSITGKYDPNNLPENFKAWMKGYENQIKYVIENNIQSNDEIKDKWNSLENGKTKSNILLSNSVAPIIQTKWDQGQYYNDSCPYSSVCNGNSPTGCVATAMAQIMKKWKYPSIGFGSHTYIINTTILSANFGETNYHWSDIEMPNTLTSPDTAVSILMHDCGVSVDMKYPLSPTDKCASGAWIIEADEPQHCAEYALKNYFGYKNTLKGIRRSDFQLNWIDKLKAELDNDRPVLYAASDENDITIAHAFICDGYKENDYFHFNWGWSGQSDNFFTMDDLNPNINNTIYHFNDNQEAVIGIEPAASPLDVGLVAFYPFNGNANDESGNGSNATNHGATLTTDRFENVNSALKFDGTNFIEANISNPQALTASLWYYLDEEPSVYWPALFGYANKLTVNVLGTIDMNKIRKVFTYIGISNGNVSYIETKNALALYQWHHIVVTYDKSNTKFKLYADGEFQGEQTIDCQFDGNLIMCGGVDSRWSANPEKGMLNGKLDDIRIYNRALSDAEVQALYNEGDEITIGSQTWMKRNLDVAYYRNGDVIPQVTDQNQWANLTTGAWCYYSNDPSNGAIYGRIYNWYAVNDPRGLAPEGWHIASDAEWSTLTTFLGGESIAGGKMKETGFAHWQYPNTGATNECGFNGLPGGSRWSSGLFDPAGTRGLWWTSTISEANISRCRAMNYNVANVIRDVSYNIDGLSVRCVKDEIENILPSVKTTNITAISNNSAKSGGNVTDDGGAAVTERGVCWNTTGNPTTSDFHASYGTGIGSYYINMTSLLACTKYHVRAYAINSVGTAYGNEIDFTTAPQSFELALWLNSESIPLANNTKLAYWLDASMFSNNAVQPDAGKQPVFVTNQYNGLPAVQFTRSPYQALSKVLQIPNSPASINSVSSKGLFVVFSTGNDIITRQIVYESGGLNSGINIYVDAGTINFGLWRSTPSLTKRFISKPIAANTTYFAYFEYNPPIINIYLNGSIVSSTFNNLSVDLTANGVGGAYLGTRTNCCNYGSTYDLWFTGLLYEIMLTNDPTKWTCISDYFCSKYNLPGCPPINPRIGSDDDWVVSSDEEIPLSLGQIEMSAPSPNPFSGSATFNLRVASQQNVRIELFDAIGYKVTDIFNGIINNNQSYEYSIDGTNLPSGLYLIKVNGENFIKTESVILIK